MSELAAEPLTVGMVLFPGFTQLDLTGPYEVFARLPQTRVRLLAASAEPVPSEQGLAICPDMRFADCPKLDVLFVPGGPGIGPAMENDELLDFLRARGPQARYVTAVCTGSLLLAAAGLLEGCRATTHWLSLELLEAFGVEPVPQRVVIDGNRITGGGVTAGIDFALTIAAQCFGEDVAKEVQLLIEYDPAPPFGSGSPRTADAALVQRVRDARRELQDQRRLLVQRVAARQRRPT